jgi:hypothetical protein
LRLTILFLLYLVPGAMAQTGDYLERSDFEVVLFPVVHETPIPGGYGSLWETEMWVRNSAGEPVIFGGQGEPYCPDPFCFGGIPVLLAPGTSRIVPAMSPLWEGGLFYLEKKFSDQVFFSLRVRDLSRNEESAGTYIPVVRESELYSEAFELLNVPMDAGRVHLRLYGLSDRQPTVQLTIFRADSEEVLFSAHVLLYGHSPSTDFPAEPSERVLYGIADLLPEGAHSSVRIRIEPVDEGLYWAYATVTNDSTQQVTVIAPD